MLSRSLKGIDVACMECTHNHRRLRRRTMSSRPAWATQWEPISFKAKCFSCESKLGVTWVWFCVLLLFGWFCFSVCVCVCVCPGPCTHWTSALPLSYAMSPFYPFLSFSFISFKKDFLSFFKKNIIVVLWYIVTFTKVLTIYHSWILPLHLSPLSLPLPFLE
jgi:hypothetical protein